MAQETGKTIAIMSPGDMGHAIGRVLLDSNKNKIRIITNLTGRSERTRRLSNSAGIIDVKTDEELIKQADFVFSILVPSEAMSLAERLAPLVNIKQNIIYVDMNATARETARSMASLFLNNNFVDGSIIGFPPLTTKRTPSIYLSGEYAKQVADIFININSINVHNIGDDIGQASTLKMCYASLNKGVTAIHIQSCVTAKIFGLDEILFDELRKFQPEILNELSGSIPHMPPRAARWIGEMEEISKMYKSIGLSGKIFEGAAETYKFVADKTILGKEILEERKRGQTLQDALTIMSECLNK